MRHQFISEYISEAKIIYIVLIVVCSSCSPTIYYLGDTHPQTNEIDVFYDTKDVKREYRTIGSLTHDKYVDYDIDLLKELMISKAKERAETE